MPAKSQSQRGLIFSRRDQYGSKKNTPKKWKWIWDEDWENKGKLPKRKKKSKKKNESLVHENIDFFLNESLDDIPEEAWISPGEAELLYVDAVETSDTVDEVAAKMKEIFNEYPYMNKELGEIEGHDFYADAYKSFEKYFYEKFPNGFPE